MTRKLRTLLTRTLLAICISAAGLAIALPLVAALLYDGTQTSFPLWSRLLEAVLCGALPLGCLAVLSYLGLRRLADKNPGKSQ